jgi:hypothetical protein
MMQMKKAYALLLALLLILTGCAGEEKHKTVSVEDVCCPYEINHENNGVTLTLQDGDKSGIQWRVENDPEGICRVTQEDAGREYTCRYRVSGIEEGAAQLTFTALKADDTVRFALTLVVNVDPDGRTVVTSYQHRQREEASVDANGLNYKWNVDIDGVLNFSFLNQEDRWSVGAEESDAIIMTNMMSTPAGCKFSAEARAVGQATVVLVGEMTQRTVQVVIQADDSGKMQVISVQEL